MGFSLSIKLCLFPPLEVLPWLRVFSACVAPVPIMPVGVPPTPEVRAVDVPAAAPAAVLAAVLEPVARPVLADSPLRLPALMSLSVLVLVPVPAALVVRKVSPSVSEVIPAARAPPRVPPTDLGSPSKESVCSSRPLRYPPWRLNSSIVRAGSWVAV